MCGRFGFTAGSKEIGRLFSVRNVPKLPLSYNIAPSQQIPGVGNFDGKEREVRLLHWGLIPSWAKDSKTGYSLINARGETLDTKPAFRSAFIHRRLIIPASYFFEWKHDAKEKFPYLIRLKEKEAVWHGRSVGALDGADGRGDRFLHDRDHGSERCGRSPS